MPDEKMRAGAAVDSHGGPVVDPTENVKALMEASITSIQREQELHARLSSSELKRLETELGWQDRMAVQRSENAKEIRNLESDRLDKIRQVDVLAGNTAADRALIAIQTLATQTSGERETLRAMVASTATTIAAQTQATMATVNEKISELQKNAFLVAGRAGVSDPQIERMSKLLEQMQHTRPTDDPRIAQVMAMVEANTKLIAGGAARDGGINDTWKLIIVLAGMALGFYYNSNKQPTAPVYIPAQNSTVSPVPPVSR